MAATVMGAIAMAVPSGAGAGAAPVGPLTVVADDAEVDARGYYGATLRATVLDDAGQPAPGVPVEFQEHHGGGAANRRLCEGVTDAAGVVTCADNPRHEGYAFPAGYPEIHPTAGDTEVLAYVKGGAFEHDLSVGRFRVVPDTDL